MLGKFRKSKLNVLENVALIRCFVLNVILQRKQEKKGMQKCRSK